MKHLKYMIFAAAALLAGAKAQAVEDYGKLLSGENDCQKGLITLHLKAGKVYFELPDSLMGREFIMGSTIKSISDNANGVVGSKPLEFKHFCFTKVDSTIQMRTVPTYFLSEDVNIAAALQKSHVGPIVKTFAVEAYSADSTSVVFNATDLFLEHDKDMSPFIDYAAYGSYTRKETFKKELSYIESVKAFEDNVSVTSLMSYVYDMTSGPDSKQILSAQPLTAELTRSIVLLPEKIYHPRAADYRIGVFWTERTKLADEASNSRKVYLANRWRVEPSDTLAYKRGELVEPVKPIVFYIDSNFPEWWKPYITEAVEQWNEPFAAIGFKNAVKALPFPADDPEFDPDNIKYSCIRYAPVSVQNAMGPSWVDPRSGEIINASVYVYHDIVKLIQRWLFVQTAQADPEVRTARLSHEVLGDAIRYVVSHEVGHCLGFMHNMGASATIPVEMLRDPEFTQKTGTTPSIMDYARFNYVAQPGDKERGVKLTPPRFGEYDRYLVRWTYTPVFDLALEDEMALTSQWISDALLRDDCYRYGKQQMNSVFFDPRSQNEDLGDDSVAASRYGVANLKYITENFMDWLSEGDEDYELRTAIYNGILNQYLTYAQHVTLNIGGLYKNEIKAGDVMPRYRNIPADKQKEALDFLFQMWEEAPALAAGNGIDRLPIVGSPVYAIRNSIENFILMTPGLASMSDGVDTYELSSRELFAIIKDKVFGPTQKGKKLTPEQRAFQRNFVESYMSMGNFKLPGSARSFAYSADFEPTHDHFCCSADEHENSLGELMYSPVSGYEWNPRNIFNQGDLTMPLLYSVLCDVRSTLQKKVKSAKGEDKAHYQFLLSTINYSVR